MQQFLHNILVFVWGYIFDHEGWRDSRLYWRGVVSVTKHRITGQAHYRLVLPKVWLDLDPEMETEFELAARRWTNCLPWRGSGR